MLEVRSLQKRFGPIAAVDDVSFRIESGQRFGLLGPNGAGKTTTISVIVGGVTPDAGQVLIDGQPLTWDTDPAKQRIGYVPQELALYEDLTATGNLEIFGALYRLSGQTLKNRVAAVLDIVGLTDRPRDKVQDFSGGMKRRLNLAAALLHEPRLLILDEPTVGVDPQSRNAIFENLLALNRDGMTLLYTTHYMEEVEKLCDRVAVMDGGKIVANGTLPEIYRLLPTRNRLMVELAPTEDVKAAPSSWTNALQSVIPGVQNAAREGDTLTVELTDLTTDVPAVLRWLGDHGLAYLAVSSERPGLEEVFLHLTGRKLRD